MSIDWDDRIQRIIEDDPKLSDERRQQALGLLNQVRADIAATVETDPDVLRQVDEYRRSSDELLNRFLAGEISGDTFYDERMRMMRAAPIRVVKMAARIQHAIKEAMLDSGELAH